MADFSASHPDIVYWLAMNHRTEHDFAGRCLATLGKKGALSDRQFARIYHMMDREKRRHRHWQRPGLDDIKAMIRNHDP